MRFVIKYKIGIHFQHFHKYFKTEQKYTVLPVKKNLNNIMQHLIRFHE